MDWRQSVGGADDLVGTGIDVGDDFVGVFVADTLGLEGIKQVPGEFGEVETSDAATVVDVAEGAAGVVDGAAKGHADEFALHGLQLVERCVGEEGGEVGVLEDAVVERWDEGGNEVSTAKAVVE